MSRFISISSEASVLEAAQTLLQHKASELPVTDTIGNLVGVVTKADIVRRAKTASERPNRGWFGFGSGPGKLPDNHNTHMHGLRKVRDVMSKDFHSAPEHASLTDVVRFMERHRIKWLPVVRDRKLIGIINQHGLDAAKLLLCRMAALHLDDKAIAKSKPVVMRELQRLCATCASQKRCKRDLANDPKNPVWQQYCPNAGTLVALQQQPATTILDALTKALMAAGLQFIPESGGDGGGCLKKAGRRRNCLGPSAHRERTAPAPRRRKAGCHKRVLDNVATAELSSLG